jgi:diguanylate cyclase (GGDEF)-like protein/PAS domain S-box-containing protein
VRVWRKVKSVQDLRRWFPRLAGPTSWTVTVSGQTVREQPSEFFDALVGSSDVAIIGKALDGTILSWNHGAEQLYGYSATEILGKSVLSLVPPQAHEEVPTLLARLGAGDRIDHYEAVRCRKDGSLVEVSVTTSPIHDDRGRVIGVSAISHDISSRKDLERQLEHHAFYDPLTDLPNRLLLYDRLKNALARAQRSGASVAIVFCDLDNFKQVNDTHGHTAGDEVLKILGTRLQEVIRPSDTLARFAGDEFVVVCADIPTRDAATAIATRIKEALKAPFNVAGAELTVTASVGVAIGDADTDADNLLDAADAAMYSSKHDDQAPISIFEAHAQTAPQQDSETPNPAKRDHQHAPPPTGGVDPQDACSAEQG